MVHRRIFLGLLALCSLLPLLQGRDGWWADVYEEEVVALNKIIQNPVAYRGLDVAFVITFNRVGNLENPFYTKFEKESYVNFSCWPDESPLWEKESYKNDFPYMFIERTAADSKIISMASTYDRFVVVGRVEGVFRGKPWIEVRGLKPLEQKITEPSLAHMVKAFTLKKVRRYDAAAAEFLLSRIATIPDHIKVMTLREEGICLAAADRCEDAVLPLEQALKLAPKDEEIAKLCQQVRARAESSRKGETKDAPVEDPPKAELTRKSEAKDAEPRPEPAPAPKPEVKKDEPAPKDPSSGGKGDNK